MADSADRTEETGDTVARGIAFPFRIEGNTGKISLAEGPAKIQQNVRLILNTAQGERPMRRDFGTTFAALLQETNDAALARALIEETRAALLQWEPRIMVTEARVRQGRENGLDDGEADLQIRYVYTDAPMQGEAIIPLR